MNEFARIKSISFGILSNQEALVRSVIEISSLKPSDGHTIDSTVLGSIENNVRCQTCGHYPSRCIGHFGHIDLVEPQLNPIFVPKTLKLLKCLCHGCSEILISNREYMLPCLLARDRSQDRIDFILKDVKNVAICSSCSTLKREYSEKNGIIFVDDDVLKPVEIFSILERITSDTLRALGIEQSSHPKNAVLFSFPVPPLNCRPAVISEGNICQDDMTFQLNEILKNNRNMRQLVQAKKGSSSAEMLGKFRDNLIFRIQTFHNNSLGKAKHASGRPIASLRDRLSGKTGIIRNHIIGKRLNQTARTVISPNPFLCVDEIGIPISLSETLTFPEIVNHLNKERLTKMLNDGFVNVFERNGFIYDAKSKIRFFGSRLEFGDKVNGKTIERLDVPLNDDDVVVKRNGSFYDFTCPSRKYWKSLKIGDVVHRRLMNGDIVVANRQPTLHKGSMMAFRCRLHDVSTICLNLAVTKPFNADFDGDEMTIHLPQSLCSLAELEQLMMPSKSIMSYAQKPLLNVVQDSLIGGFLMSKDDAQDNTISRERFFDALFLIGKHGGADLSQPRNGKTLLSALFPSNFCFEKGDVRIVNGKLESGRLTHSVLNGKHSIIQSLHFKHGEKETVDFINNFQFLTNFWLLEHSFSIHLGDCFIDTSFSKEIKKEFQEKKLGINDYCDVLMTRTMESLPEDNNFLVTEQSGAKGNVFNICQITCALGQQTVNGQPLQKQVHFERETHKKFGFVESGFSRGLTPKEFFHHSMAGRKGVADTAVSTAVSGYSQRCSVKLMEDMIVQSDLTIRDSNNKIFQFNFNVFGFDPSRVTQEEDGTFVFFHFQDNCKSCPKRKISNEEIEDLCRIVVHRTSVPEPVETWIVGMKKGFIRKAVERCMVCRCSLEWMSSSLPKAFYSAHFQPGECVGVIAAQSMGEFATQATLNTFHIAGSSATGRVSIGISKSQEMKNATKTPKIIFYEIHFTSDDIPENLQQVLLSDLLIDHVELFDFSDWWHQMFNVDISSFSKCIRFTLNPKLLFIHRIYPAIIKKALENLDSQVACTFPPFSSNIFVIDVFHNCTSKDLSSVLVSGIEGLNAVSRNGNVIYAENYTGKGSLRKIFNIRNVDVTKTKTSFLWDMFECFGIEATRRFMVDSYQRLLNDVNPGFISLMVDRQTHMGSVASISRYSMRLDDGVFARASFEECIENLIQAGQNSTTDNLKSIASKIIVAQKIDAGTNFCSLSSRI